MFDQGKILVLHQCEMSFRDLHIVIYTDLLSRNSGREKYLCRYKEHKNSFLRFIFFIEVFTTLNEIKIPAMIIN
jgi:hypothetical protein